MRNYLHRVELRAAVWMALALLVSQLGALSHAYAHDAALGTFAHKSGAASHNPCDDCLSFAPLLAAAGATQSPPFLDPQGRAPSSDASDRSLIDLSLRLAFRSRAPPTFS